MPVRSDLEVWYRWTVRGAKLAGAMATGIALLSKFAFSAPEIALYSAIAAAAVLLIATCIQGQFLIRGTRATSRRQSEITEITANLESLRTQNAGLLETIADLEATVDRYERLLDSLPVFFDKSSELRRHLNPAALRACLKGETREFVTRGLVTLLATLKNALKVLTDKTKDTDVTCEVHVGGRNPRSLHAPGTTMDRKRREKDYVSGSNSLHGLMLQFPHAFSGRCLESSPPRIEGRLHSPEGWQGNIFEYIRSYCCAPIAIGDGVSERIVGTLQVDSPIIDIFPVGTEQLVRSVAESMGALIQIGMLADELVTQDDGILHALKME